MYRRILTLEKLKHVLVEPKGCHQSMIHDCGGVEACGGVLWSVGECCGVLWSVGECVVECVVLSPQLQKVKREIFHLCLDNWY